MSRCYSSERGGLSPAFFSSGSRSAGACPPRSLDLPPSVVRERPFPKQIKSRCSCPTEINRRRVSEEMFFTGMIAGGRPPRYGEKNVPFTVGRGPVPRRALVHASDRGGLSPALRARKGVRLAMHPFGIRCSRTTVSGARKRSRGTGPRATVEKSVPFPVGRGPVPRHATIGKMALVGVRFSCGSSDRGGQAPALRAREGFSSPRIRSGSGEPELRCLSRPGGLFYREGIEI